MIFLYISGYAITVFIAYAILLRQYGYRRGDEVDIFFAALAWPLFALVPIFIVLAKGTDALCKLFVTPRGR